ncbi:MAG: L,D-transpeptidase [Chloroflexi bacterium]|nr:L,D-transpeptidase [Chloroflexota bacterium]
MRVVVALALLSLVLSLAPISPPSLAAEPEPEDWDIPGGHFFTQSAGGSGKGFPVLDDDQARMASEFYRLGGEAQLGYPISSRYEAGGLIHQAFQRAILRWQPEENQAQLVSIFNEVSKAGRDAWLLSTYRIPRPANWAAEAKRTPEEIVQMHQKMLDADPEMKALYFSQEDPVAYYGLPMSEVADQGGSTVLRLERAVFQKWKNDAPWAAAGTVTVVLAGDIARAVGLIPQDATRPIAPQEALDGERWIDVNLTNQRATAFIGLQAVKAVAVATGVPGLETPKGEWHIYSRVADETMDSETIGIPRSAPLGYYLKGVLFTQYFAPNGVALHYNYWTPAWQFGTQAGSHGCVGMQYDDALFMWEFGAIGMRVSVHD